MEELNIPLNEEPIIEAVDTELPIVETNEQTHEVHGLSAEELSDPNAIQVFVTDTQSPVIILFGPPACGKTMVLVRLTRYLKSQNYRVVTEGNFRPSYDTHYQQMCEGFDEMVNSDKAQQSTSLISFMLVKVLDSAGRTVCQILEAPGEYYFNPKKPKAPFPRYINEIFTSNVRKIFAFLVEPNWFNPQDRANYVDRIYSVKTNMLSKDKVIFVYNKVDKTPYVVSPGQVMMNNLVMQLQQEYPNIFNPFKNQNPLTSFFRPNNFELVPFQTGIYVDLSAGGQTYTQSHDNYPKKLWETILKMIKG